MDIAKGIAEKVTQMVMNYSEIEMKVREATNDEPWGPTGVLLQELARETNGYEGYADVMCMLWRRMLHDNKKQWRRVYKSLVVLSYLLKHGSDMVVESAHEHFYDIKSLLHFKCLDETGKDHGVNVRQKVKDIVDLLDDAEKLRSARDVASKNANKIIGFSKELADNHIDKWRTSGDDYTSDYNNTSGSYRDYRDNADYGDDDKYDNVYHRDSNNNNSNNNNNNNNNDNKYYDESNSRKDVRNDEADDIDDEDFDPRKDESGRNNNNNKRNNINNNKSNNNNNKSSNNNNTSKLKNKNINNDIKIKLEIKVPNAPTGTEADTGFGEFSEFTPDANNNITNNSLLTFDINNSNDRSPPTNNNSNEICDILGINDLDPLNHGGSSNNNIIVNNNIINTTTPPCINNNNNNMLTNLTYNSNSSNFVALQQQQAFLTQRPMLQQSYLPQQQMLITQQQQQRLQQQQQYHRQLSYPFAHQLSPTSPTFNPIGHYQPAIFSSQPIRNQIIGSPSAMSTNYNDKSLI
ncbi:hypothetical protein HELRODRAFT_188744 [Helobdella robusta]|uniref:ENTH domain-containing protein n=1 Tax=Helobdella robusta TaxID=6412 RepID=T1FQB7_HELRO|nr:hypothetical protein HELRODRAFT_188744 [Helobdella robusta]ESO02536.1 hypothetical protein HELRODRAFT_188744 [Helobdella robusta]